MGLLNRSAIIIKPREPYLRWAEQDDAEGLAKTVFETLQTEPTVCLVPEFDDADDGKLLLTEYWRTIFELMLESWTTDPSLWPKNLTLESFGEWFDVDLYPSVADTVADEPLKDIEL